MDYNHRNIIDYPDLIIEKNDSKFLSKTQIKKAQFLFENDYFIWNEAEMFLRYYDLFSNIPNSDSLYENLCKTTRVVFNIIHSVHYAGTGSNVAHLKFYEVLDAWGALTIYLKANDTFPEPFLEWFDSLFKIYQMSEESSNERVIPFESVLRLYTLAGADATEANEAFKLATANSHHKLTFERVLYLIKQIVISDELKNASYSLVPKMQNYLLIDSIEKPHDQVLRNYDFNETVVSGLGSPEKAPSVNTPRASQNSNRHLYTNLFDWKTLNDQYGLASNENINVNATTAQDHENHDLNQNEDNAPKKANLEQKQAEDNQVETAIHTVSMDEDLNKYFEWPAMKEKTTVNAPTSTKIANMVKNQAAILASAMTPSNTSNTSNNQSQADAGKYVQPPAPTQPPPPPPQQPPPLPPSSAQSKLPKILAPYTAGTNAPGQSNNTATAKSAIPTPLNNSSGNSSTPSNANTGSAQTQTLVVKPIRAPAPKTANTSVPPLPTIVKPLTTLAPTGPPTQQSNSNSVNKAQPAPASAAPSGDSGKPIRHPKPPTATKVVPSTLPPPPPTLVKTTNSNAILNNLNLNISAEIFYEKLNNKPNSHESESQSNQTNSRVPVPNNSANSKLAVVKNSKDGLPNPNIIIHNVQKKFTINESNLSTIKAAAMAINNSKKLDLNETSTKNSTNNSKPEVEVGANKSLQVQSKALSVTTNSNAAVLVKQTSTAITHLNIDITSNKRYTIATDVNKSGETTTQVSSNAGPNTTGQAQASGDQSASHQTTSLQVAVSKDTTSTNENSESVKSSKSSSQNKSQANNDKSAANDVSDQVTAKNQNSIAKSNIIMNINPATAHNNHSNEASSMKVRSVSLEKQDERSQCDKEKLIKIANTVATAALVTAVSNINRETNTKPNTIYSEHKMIKNQNQNYDNNVKAAKSNKEDQAKKEGKSNLSQFKYSSSIDLNGGDDEEANRLLQEQFRITDFRREFKRSASNLNANLSKSINTLDTLNKNTSGNNSIVMSTSQCDVRNKDSEGFGYLNHKSSVKSLNEGSNDGSVTDSDYEGSHEVAKFKSLKDELKRRSSVDHYNAKSPLLFKTPRSGSSKKSNSKEEATPSGRKSSQNQFECPSEKAKDHEDANRVKKANKQTKSKQKGVLGGSRNNLIDQNIDNSLNNNRRPSQQQSKRSNGFKTKNRSFSSTFDSTSVSSQSSSESTYLSDSNLVTASNERSISRNQRKRSLKRSPIANTKNLMFSTDNTSPIIYSQYEAIRNREQTSHRPNSKEPASSRQRAPSEQSRNNADSLFGKDLIGKSKYETQANTKLKFSHLLEKFNSASQRDDSVPVPSNPSRLANRERERELRENRESKVRSSTPKMYNTNNEDGVSSIVNKSSNSFSHSQNPSSTSYATTFGPCSNPMTPNVDHISNHSSYLNPNNIVNFNNQTSNSNLSMPVRMKNNGDFIRNRIDLEERETRSERFARRNYTFNPDLACHAKAQSYAANEPMKSIVNAITLSSLDTLNDIDSDENNQDSCEQDEEEEEEEEEEENEGEEELEEADTEVVEDDGMNDHELDGMEDEEIDLDNEIDEEDEEEEIHNEFLVANNDTLQIEVDSADMNDDKDLSPVNPRTHRHLLAKSSEKKAMITRNNENEDNLLSAYQSNAASLKQLKNRRPSTSMGINVARNGSRNRSGFENGCGETDFTKNDKYEDNRYLTSSAMNSKHRSISSENPKLQRKLNNQVSKQMTRPNEWSVAKQQEQQPVSGVLLSLTDQHIIAEVVRQLKPFISKCVRKEVRGIFDKRVRRSDEKLSSKHSSQSAYKQHNNASGGLTRIGDF